VLCERGAYWLAGVCHPHSGKTEPPIMGSNLSRAISLSSSYRLAAKAKTPPVSHSCLSLSPQMLREELENSFDNYGHGKKILNQGLIFFQ